MNKTRLRRKRLAARKERLSGRAINGCAECKGLVKVLDNKTVRCRSAALLDELRRRGMVNTVGFVVSAKEAHGCRGLPPTQDFEHLKEILGLKAGSK